MIVDINQILEIKAILRAINSVPLEKIVFVKNGKIVLAPSETLNNWQYIGLNNTDFIEHALQNDGIDNIENQYVDLNNVEHELFILAFDYGFYHTQWLNSDDHYIEASESMKKIQEKGNSLALVYNNDTFDAFLKSEKGKNAFLNGCDKYLK